MSKANIGQYLYVSSLCVMSVQKALVLGDGGQTDAKSGVLATTDASFFLPLRSGLGALAQRQGYSRNT